MKWVDQDMTCNSPSHHIKTSKHSRRLKPVITTTGLLEPDDVDDKGLSCPAEEEDFRYSFCNLFKLLTCRQVSAA